MKPTLKLPHYLTCLFSTFTALPLRAATIVITLALVLGVSANVLNAQQNDNTNPPDAAALPNSTSLRNAAPVHSQSWANINSPGGNTLDRSNANQTCSALRSTMPISRPISPPIVIAPTQVAVRPTNTRIAPTSTLLPTNTRIAPTSTPAPTNTRIAPTNTLAPTRESVRITSIAPITANQITGFTLVNADTNTDIKTLTNGDVLNLALLPTRNLNIRANSAGSVASVNFRLNDSGRTENSAPFAVWSDNNGDYAAWQPTLGTYVLSATPYSQVQHGGAVGQTLTITFAVVHQAAPATQVPRPTSAPTTASITSFTLVNADTNTDIKTLTNGEVLNLTLLPTQNLNIRANGTSAVSTVRFALNSTSRTENTA
ncbi:hypothetical protein HC928_25920, partial [bacterium]|nr:hypothetical protein [bacterium]